MLVVAPMANAAMSVTDVTVIDTPACFMARAIRFGIGNCFRKKRTQTMMTKMKYRAKAEGEVGNDLDELKEIMFSNVDSDVPLSWKEDLEDSETEMDNFVSQFTI
ncbi:hypothetical protein DAPPUDRAFT_248096 [Daphnia pulex]|uniref:Uncharacterized protein n=1 Tax=Daphnia pulex TaxID=6669 RepID=E9GTN1_DAPPU|nr:hypothetical protein DAPPUDRAFT_248096 [Daphnia pulex]|eukprot:EFX77182.1 hypothetical protein DAPPUDRAFT_248096 [Daphnia pulex]